MMSALCAWMSQLNGPIGIGPAIPTGKTSNCTVLGTNHLFEDMREKQMPSILIFFLQQPLSSLSVSSRLIASFQ